MALIKCSECETEVSDQAKTCPKCGAQLRKPRRSVFGQIMKWIFIAFNGLMVYVLIKGISAVSEASGDFGAMNEYEQAGTAIGAGLGIGVILVLWAIGSIILGLMVLVTRPK